MARVAIVGLTTVDVIRLPGADPVTRAGGTPIYGARALAALGEPVAVATRCHDRSLTAGIPASPLCVQIDPESMISELTYHEHGERTQRLGAIGSDWLAEDVRGFAWPAVEPASWIHVGGQRGGDFPAEALAALAEGGRSLALDAQGPLRCRTVGPMAYSGTLEPELLAHVRALKLSEEEADAAFGTLDAVAIRAACGVAEVIVTLGIAGARIASPVGAATIDADPVPEADTTGAGDAFLATYCASRAGGLAPHAATQRACLHVATMLRSG